MPRSVSAHLLLWSFICISMEKRCSSFCEVAAASNLTPAEAQRVYKLSSDDPFSASPVDPTLFFHPSHPFILNDHALLRHPLPPRPRRRRQRRSHDPRARVRQPSNAQTGLCANALTASLGRRRCSSAHARARAGVHPRRSAAGPAAAAATRPSARRCRQRFVRASACSAMNA
jgi:hypothetical protein